MPNPSSLFCILSKGNIASLPGFTGGWGLCRRRYPFASSPHGDCPRGVISPKKRNEYVEDCNLPNSRELQSQPTSSLRRRGEGIAGKRKMLLLVRLALSVITWWFVNYKSVMSTIELCGIDHWGMQTLRDERAVPQGKGVRPGPLLRVAIGPQFCKTAYCLL